MGALVLGPGMAGTLADVGARVARGFQLFARWSCAEALLQDLEAFQVAGRLPGPLRRGLGSVQSPPQAAAIEADQWSATCLAALRSSARIESARVIVSWSPARCATRRSSS